MLIVDPIVTINWAGGWEDDGEDNIYFEVLWNIDSVPRYICFFCAGQDVCSTWVERLSCPDEKSAFSPSCVSRREPACARGTCPTYRYNFVVHLLSAKQRSEANENYNRLENKPAVGGMPDRQIWVVVEEEEKKQGLWWLAFSHIYLFILLACGKSPIR